MKLHTFLTRLIWLSVLPLLVLAVWLAYGQVRALHDDAMRENADLARHSALVADQYLRGRLNALRALAASPLVDDPARPDGLLALAQALRAQFGGEILLVDRDRRLRMDSAHASGEPSPVPPELGALPVLAKALDQGAEAIGNLVPGHGDGSPALAIAVPVQRGGRPIAALLQLLPKPELAERLSRLAPKPNRSVRIVDDRDRLLLDLGRPPQASDEEPPAVAALQLAPWRVEVATGSDEHLAPLLRAAAVLGLVVVGTTLIGLSSGQWAAHRLTRALHSLTGDASTATPAPEIAEVGTVRRMLDDAAARRDAAEAERLASERQLRATIEQAALELQVREAQLRGIFETASDAILAADTDQRIVMANPAAARVFGHAVESLVGRPLEDLVPPRFRGSHVRQMRAFGETDRAARPMGPRRDVVGLRADGSEFPAEAAISHAHVDGQHLYTVVVRDVSERRRAERELQDSRSRLETSHAELRRLIAAQDSVQEGERLRIARELHDDLQQTLAAVLMEVAAARAAAQPPAAAQAEALARIERLAMAAIASTRRVIQDLRPPMLEELGFVAALEHLVSQFAERHGLRGELDAGDFDPEAEARLGVVGTCLYRVAQEALNNVAKHAGASCARLRLSSTADGTISLAIADDGRGFADGEPRKPESFGLLGMHERVRAVGGTLHIDGRPGAGTIVEVEVPLP